MSDKSREQEETEQVQEKQARLEHEEFTVDIVKVDNEAVLLQSKVY